MKIILRELINSEKHEVFASSFTPTEPNDMDKIAREAFDFVLINYIIKQFPNGCGIRTERRFLPDGGIDLNCHCSGRNVRDAIDNDDARFNGCGQNDREYLLSILKT